MNLGFEHSADLPSGTLPAEAAVLSDAAVCGQASSLRPAVLRTSTLHDVVGGASVLVSTSEALHPKYSHRRERTLERMSSLGFSGVHIIDREPGEGDLARLGIDLWDNTDGYFVGNPGKKVHESICFKHVHALQHIVEQGLERALIVECDVLFHDNFQEMFPEFWRQVPSDFDIVYVGFGYPIKELVSSLKKPTAQIWSGAFWCCHCMIVSRAGAEKILEALPMHDQIDFFYGRMASEGRLNCYAFYYENTDLEKAGACSYIPWGLAYQEKD